MYNDKLVYKVVIWVGFSGISLWKEMEALMTFWYCLGVILWKEKEALISVLPGM